MGSGEADGVADRVSVDLELDDGGVYEPHVEPINPALPADAPLRVAQCVILHALDDLLELGLVQWTPRVRPASGKRRGRPFDELAGDPDHHASRLDARHLLCLR